MKSIKALSCLLLLLVCCGASNRGVLITWEKNTENDLAGYKVHQGLTSGDYDSTFIIHGNQNIFYKRITKDSTEYFYVVTAFDTAANESGYSEEVSIYNIMGISIPDSIAPKIPKRILGRLINEDYNGK